MKEHLIVYRIATVSDIDSILVITDQYDRGNPEWFLVECLDGGYVLIAEIEWTIVWYLLWQDLRWNTPFLSLLQVDTQYTRIWIWSGLVKYFEKYLMKEWRRSYMSSTTQKNKFSQAFHEKHWFKKSWMLDMPHGEEQFYIKEL